MELVEYAIENFGLQPHGPFNKGDNRVAFVLFVSLDPKALHMVCAIPPSSVGWVEKQTGLFAAEFHTGDIDGGPSAHTREKIAEHIENILYRWSLPGELVGEFLHARQLAYRAATRGHTWTGADEDYPPRWRVQ